MSDQSFTLNNKTYTYYALTDAAPIDKVRELPVSLKILLENLYRHGHKDIEALIDGLSNKIKSDISFYPSRVLMQDFTGVPAIVDLAALRDAAKKQDLDPHKINPQIPVDLIIDHSVTVEDFGNDQSFGRNVTREYQQNLERYRFLKWGQASFENFRVVPPGTGICHQVNLEYLAQVVWQKPQPDGTILLYPDTLVGTDSHTTMVNGLSVLGWGVGGIEAEAAMLGLPLSLLMPTVVGVHLKGQLPPGSTATDLVLTLTQLLRQKGVVGKFVEFYGPGLNHLTLPDRATIANMSPEFGATCAFFPIDDETLNYLALTGRNQEHIAIVEAYTKAQGLWHDPECEPLFDETLEVNLADIEPSVSGPKRPQDRVPLSQVPVIAQQMTPPSSAESPLKNHDVVIAAITSCTNTSNPVAMIGAGLMARKARALGLTPKPWVKTSLAPGSKAVSDYLQQAGSMPDLEALGFYLVGYGCTTCIGNSGPLSPDITKTIEENDLTVSSVLSGNRNFEGRIHPLVKANYLASPMLVVAYALAGTTLVDLTRDPLADGVYLKDIWPTSQEIQTLVDQCLTPELFKRNYENVFNGDDVWQAISIQNSVTYPWDDNSTYIKRPPFLDAPLPTREDIHGARILGIFGDSITTDHISPAGSIRPHSPAAEYLSGRGVAESDFNSYGSRRGHDEVMARGTFSNVRLQNEMVPGKTGGFTVYDGQVVTIFEAARRYKMTNTPLVIIAGREYGSGSSRDWAAKGPALLGVRAVIAESFERIHRSNLVGMGILPLEFAEGLTRHRLNLDGTESISIEGVGALTVGALLQISVHHENGNERIFTVKCRIDTSDELSCFNQCGILCSVLGQLKE
ncbi:aconitate hydratase AcnA [Candidatus Finniella inopinata]|uniref:Aconitate hydratase n=1 Tax=Candidatus Finniella inopinata TaxID=1696036 RepID=A0A4Q7DJQ9_9PROT|nr:aconitate hydratase AcnA [Candidatus Finniella inopinata]RZI46274.1 aconitate hydratase AcnA [Candidatus Finniella inopinata]